jgi:ribosomal protein S27E
MGIETIITCDVCDKEVGKPGSGSKGEYIDCNTHTPGGFINLLARSKTRWAICAKCFGQMWRLLREHQNPEVECHTCGKTLPKDEAAITYTHRGPCFWNSGLKPKVTVKEASECIS